MTLKLNGTNSVAAPAYAGDDADTGLQCGTNELNLVTGGTARVKIASDGAVQLLSSTGIDFSGVQTNASGMFSETLDSYEEGTFTPSLTSESPGTLSFSAHANNGGTYVKIGRIVFVSINLRGTLTTGTATGNSKVNGLPFAVAANNVANSIAGASAYASAAVPYAAGMDQPSGVFNSGALFKPNSSEILFYEQSESGESNVIISRFASGLNIHFSGIYLVATA